MLTESIRFFCHLLELLRGKTWSTFSPKKIYIYIYGMLLKVRLISVVFVTSRLDIHFLWNLFFFLFLLPAPCAAFSATICWYFFLLFLVREEGNVSAFFSKVEAYCFKSSMYKWYSKSQQTPMRTAGFCDKLFRPFLF